MIIREFLSVPYGESNKTVLRLSMGIRISMGLGMAVSKVPASSGLTGVGNTRRDRPVDTNVAPCEVPGHSR